MLTPKGSWQVPERSVGISLIGGADLDFGDAGFPAAPGYVRPTRPA